MAGGSERTEKPTPRRLDRARREGNFVSSREFISAVQFLGFAALAAALGGAGFARLARLMRLLISQAFSLQLTPASLAALTRLVIGPEMGLLILCGVVLTMLVVFTQLVVTRFGFSVDKLAPDIKRLNPIAKLTALPGQNLPLFCQALMLLALVGAAFYYEVAGNLVSYLDLAWLDPRTAAARTGATLQALFWRAAMLFMLVGVTDLVWQRRRFLRQLRMSKQEIREEAKEQEGNPQTKMRIRRIQRDLSRRRMMQAVPKATAVIVNPTHYAVALLYSTEAPGAPRVVAKGKNYLARRIRQIAIEHQVPIIENPPLAQALYASVDVGREIPSHLYRAVAEVLAYIYRLMNGRLPGG